MKIRCFLSQAMKISEYSDPQPTKKQHTNKREGYNRVAFGKLKQITFRDKQVTMKSHFNRFYKCLVT